MRIIKLAAGVPDGFVKVRISIDKQGNFKRQIVREGKSRCQSGDDKKLLEDLLGAQVTGYFGAFGEVSDAGHTSEYYEQTRVQPTPAAATPEEERPHSPQPQAPQRQREYGV